MIYLPFFLFYSEKWKKMAHNVDCLNEIFEYLENDDTTLYSCLLVNRLCCEVSVKFFLKNLSKLSLRSNIYPEFFYQLYQICHNIKTLRIEFMTSIPNELKDLISVQKNLKHLYLSQSDYSEEMDLDLKSIIPLLTKHS